MDVDSCAAIGVGPPIAQVAELVDAQVSGTCDRKVVEVRVFFWAPLRITRKRPAKVGIGWLSYVQTPALLNHRLSHI